MDACTDVTGGDPQTQDEGRRGHILSCRLTVRALLHRYPFPVVFSSCSRKDLEASLEKGMGMCLFNLPEVKQSFGGRKCGNGYVEEGEECDCGEPEVRETFPGCLSRIPVWAKKRELGGNCVAERKC